MKCNYTKEKKSLFTCIVALVTLCGSVGALLLSGYNVLLAKKQSEQVSGENMAAYQKCISNLATDKGSLRKEMDDFIDNSYSCRGTQVDSSWCEAVRTNSISLTTSIDNLYSEMTADKCLQTNLLVSLKTQVINLKKFASDEKTDSSAFFDKINAFESDFENFNRTLPIDLSCCKP